MVPVRRLGKTELNVSALGFGGAGIGNLYRAVSDEAARASIEGAFAAGARLFDTAPFYGFGLSEQRVGATLRDLDPDEKIILSTKVGRVLEPAPDDDVTKVREGYLTPLPVRPVFDYSYDGVMRSYEASLKRLGRSRIDILLAHDLGAATHTERHDHYFRQFKDGGYRAMRELRDSGAVAAIGLGVNEWEICEQALDHGDFDCFLLAGRYTLLEQTALDSFLPRCTARGVSLVIGGPYNSGILATGVKGKGPFYYNYEAAPPDIIDRVRRIESVCDRLDVPLAAAAMQFPLAHPQVAAVIPGMVSAAEAQAAKANLEHAIPAEFWEALRQDGLLHPAAPTP
jgi:D-threo-aldose 1-dehydrogenase